MPQSLVAWRALFPAMRLSRGPRMAANDPDGHRDHATKAWPVFTTDEATTAETLPESIIIVGGGVIGCEFATAYAELGVRTIVVEMLPSLLAALDADAGKAMTASLKARGAEIHLGARITQMSVDDAGVSAVLEGAAAPARGATSTLTLPSPFKGEG
jgi:pyruvate/2-oxoglutarate dehydrogenase complex dihydrolipoamide dehydrogenase (E3) component